LSFKVFKTMSDKCIYFAVDLWVTGSETFYGSSSRSILNAAISLGTDVAVAFFKCILIQCLIVSIRKTFLLYHPRHLRTVAEFDFYFKNLTYFIEDFFLVFVREIICDKSIGASILPKSIRSFITSSGLSDCNPIHCHRICLCCFQIIFPLLD